MKPQSIYSGFSVLYEETMTGSATYIYGPEGKLTKRITINGETDSFFYHTDRLRSTRLVTDENRNIVTGVTYHPFGESSTEEGSRAYLFTGKEQDATGLYYIGARYYDPGLGRFIARDQEQGRISNPKTLNRYTYCFNNPLKYIDPDGHDPSGPDWLEKNPTDSETEYSWDGAYMKFALWIQKNIIKMMSRWGGWIVDNRSENSILGIGAGVAGGAAGIVIGLGNIATLGTGALFSYMFIKLSESAEFYYELWNNDPQFRELLVAADHYVRLLEMGVDCEQEAADAVLELSIYMLQARYGDDWRKYAPSNILMAYDMMTERQKQEKSGNSSVLSGNGSNAGHGSPQNIQVM